MSPRTHVLVAVSFLFLSAFFCAADSGEARKPAGGDPPAKHSPSRAPGLSVVKTVTDEVGICGAESTITVAPGTTVTYCYRAENTGTERLHLSSLWDDTLGHIPFADGDLPSGGVITVKVDVSNVQDDVTNVAWWLVSSLESDWTVNFSDTATVLVDAQTLTCDGPAVRFESGMPVAFTIDSAGRVYWSTTDDLNACDGASAVNETGGTGEAACASADTLNETPALYSTAMYLNPVSLLGTSEALLQFRWRHRQTNNSEFAVAMNTDGGPLWDGVFWDSAGNPGGSDGDLKTIDLQDYVGNPAVYIGFAFNGDDWDWYAQVDEIRLLCPQFADGFESGDTSEWSAESP